MADPHSSKNPHDSNDPEPIHLDEVRLTKKAGGSTSRAGRPVAGCKVCPHAERMRLAMIAAFKFHNAVRHEGRDPYEVMEEIRNSPDYIACQQNPEHMADLLEFPGKLQPRGGK